MSPRSFGRNVHLKFEGDEEPFGGMTISPHNNDLKITNSQLLRFLEILIVPELPDAEVCAEGSVYQVFLGQDEIIANEEFVRAGTYLISPRLKDPEVVKLRTTNDRVLSRALSYAVSGRDSSFMKAVRERDEGCCVSNGVNVYKPVDLWPVYEAAHIFPLECGSEFVGNGYDRFITEGKSAVEKLNSAQNGMVLNASLHYLFDHYMLGIDVDAGYKVVAFIVADTTTEILVGGKTLAPWARQNGNVGVRDELLRWHLRMCVLANMKGAGEPVWDYVGADDIAAGACLAEDPSGERFGLEVSMRLAREGFF